MDETQTFTPSRRNGLIFAGVTIPALTLASGVVFARVTQAQIGPEFLLYLFLAVFIAAPIPLMGYRAFSLSRAAYHLHRDGVNIQWGLRVENIPMTAVEWVRKSSDLEEKQPRPWLRWPGAVLGTRRLPESGQIVEFLADNTSRLVLIATPERIYAISPANADEFLIAFQRLIELGSLDPIPARSVYPAFLLGQLWADRPARILVLGGALLSLGLLIWVGLAVPNHPEVSLGFSSDGSPLNPVPGVQLFLLPVVDAFFFLAGTGLGLYFYRRDGGKPVAYLLWSSGALMGALFLAGLAFIL